MCVFCFLNWASKRMLAGSPHRYGWYRKRVREQKNLLWFIFHRLCVWVSEWVCRRWWRRRRKHEFCLLWHIKLESHLPFIHIVILRHICFLYRKVVVAYPLPSVRLYTILFSLLPNIFNRKITINFTVFSTFSSFRAMTLTWTWTF